MKERELPMYGLYDSTTDCLIKESICYSIKAVRGYAMFAFNCAENDLSIRGLVVVPVTLTYSTPTNE